MHEEICENASDGIRGNTVGEKEVGVVNPSDQHHDEGGQKFWIQVLADHSIPLGAGQEFCKQLFPVFSDCVDPLPKLRQAMFQVIEKVWIHFQIEGREALDALLDFFRQGQCALQQRGHLCVGLVQEALDDLAGDGLLAFKNFIEGHLADPGVLGDFVQIEILVAVSKELPFGDVQNGFFQSLFFFFFLSSPRKIN